MFKEGDKVVRTKNFLHDMQEGQMFTVFRVDGGSIWLKEILGCYSINSFKLAKTPRPHAELIKQWAEDSKVVIQCFNEFTEEWYDILDPFWDQGSKYRVKPQSNTLKKIEELEVKLKELKETL